MQQCNNSLHLECVLAHLNPAITVCMLEVECLQNKNFFILTFQAFLGLEIVVDIVQIKKNGNII